ncbi:SusC/RagA family TonB-linked outer membrane protein [Chitinophaga pollutisoli]|uniref:SusC/RagA family TonB-linked outer membrane protein n=1 Tax=Chitinophaga pollutisoli TaxID=3133966 RepID=A0ABZ2YRF3_9BACT
MKLTSILLLAICLHVSASTFSQSVTFSGREVPMKKVFATIKKQTGYVVWGKSELLQQAGAVSASVQNMPLLSFLDLILKDQPLQYKIADNTIFLYAKNDPALRNDQQVQQTPVTGRIADSTGMPLIGATIAVAGGRSAITDVNGAFSLPVNAGNVMRISFIGYTTKSVAVTEAMLKAGTVGTVVLSAVTSTLTELNVTANTGYQSIPKERATGSFGIITEEVIGARMQTSLLDRLEGTVPGLFMQNGNVNIRGLATLRAEQRPLYVVDGFPYEGDLNYLNPADVVNVTVMKDAAAASIYGTRAANGVISITTRTGSPRKLTVNFSSTLFVTPKPDASYQNFLNSRQMVDIQQELFNTWHPSFNDGIRREGKSKALEALYDHEQGVISKAELDATLDKLRGYDGQGQLEDLYMRNRIKHRQSFSASGGNDIHRYNIFMNYTGNSGYGLRTSNEDINIGLRDNVKVFKWLDAEIGATTNIRKGKFLRQGPESFYRNMPYEIMRYADGSLAPFTMLKSPYEIERLKAMGLYDETYNPLDEMEKSHLSYWSNYFRLQGGFTVKFAKGISLDLKYQTERGTSYNKEHYTGDSYYAKNLINDAVTLDSLGNPVFNMPEGGQIYETRGNSTSYTARAQLNFDREIAPRHRLTALAGMERRAILNTSTSLYKMGYNDNNLTFRPVDETVLGSLKGTQSLSSTFFWDFSNNTNFRHAEERYVSAYANAAYSFNSRYNITGSARVDDSNLFGSDPRYRHLPLWSVGASWRITEEDFMKNLQWLNTLVVRTTYGLGGNVARQVGPFLQAQADFVNETNAMATSIILPPNKTLRWEKTATTNIGIDVAVLNNRILASFDYYLRKSTDLLGEKLTDPTNAFPFALINYGSMQNRGYEVSLNTRNIEGKHFTWSSSLAMSFNKNRMTDINLRDVRYDMLTNGYGVNRVGYPMDAVFSFRYAGLDPTNGSVLVYDADGKVVTNYDQSGAIVPNMTDVNGLVYNGTLRPKFTTGFTNNFTYKDFSLNIMLIANGGNVIRDVVSPIQSNFGRMNVDARMINFWRKPGDENIPGMLPAPDLKNNGREYYNLIWFANDRNVLKADYIKVRDIALTYNFAKVLAPVTKLQSALLTLQVQNPFSWFRNGSGIDPEAYTLGSTYASRTLPVMRTFMAGLNITF